MQARSISVLPKPPAKNGFVQVDGGSFGRMCQSKMLSEPEYIIGRMIDAAVTFVSNPGAISA